MASLTSLPADVFCCIVQRMDGDCEGSIVALAATCRSFHELVMPLLYNPSLVDRHPFLIYWAAQFGLVATATRLVHGGGARVDLAMQFDAPKHRYYFGLHSFCRGQTPRQVYHALHTHGEVVEVKSDPAKHYKNYWYPIHLAVMSGSVEMVEFLIGASPKQISALAYCLCPCSTVDLSYDVTPRQYYCSLLHIAACHKRVDVFKWLLEHDVSRQAGLDCNHAPRNYTALHHASRFGLVDMIRFILDGGYETDVNVLDASQLSPIWHAYLYSEWAAFDMLIARGADIDDDIGYGYTPLIEACLHGRFENAAELVDRGANVNVGLYACPSSVNQPANLRPIDICCTRRSSQLFMDFTSDPVSQTWVPEQCQRWDDHIMEKVRCRGVVSKLLAAGADIGPSLDHAPPLVLAAANHLSDIVEELIKHGAPVNLPDRNGVSPLAATFAYSDSHCPFHFNEYQDDNNRVAFAASTKPREHRTHGMRDPHEGGCPELRACVDLLVQNGANVNQADVDGNVPLSLLCVASSFRDYLGDRGIGYVRITRPDRSRIAPLLLQHGANPEAMMAPIFPRGYKLRSYKVTSMAQWELCRWPLTVVQHAYWDADFELCQQLLAAGAMLDQRTVRWMVSLMLERGSGNEQDSGLLTQEILEFTDNLPPRLRRNALRNPEFLALALWAQWLDRAEEIWSLGLELCRFSEKVQWHQSGGAARPKCDEEWVEVGMLCLQEAVRADAISILEGLLDLGVKNIPNSALLLAIRKRNLGMLETLVQHGATVHVRDNETDGSGHILEYSFHQHEDNCVSPMKLAIEHAYHQSIRVMLNGPQSPVDPWFRFFYLKEAYTKLQPATLSCLLEHRSIHMDESDITDATDLPLAHLVRNAEKICAVLYEGIDKKYEFTLFKKRDPRGFGIEKRLKNVSKWVGCVAAFAQAGADPTMKDKAGKSALDYLGAHMAYVGRNRFKNHLASQLRSQLGEGRTEDQLDPLACYEALKSFVIEPEPKELREPSQLQSQLEPSPT